MTLNNDTDVDISSIQLPIFETIEDIIISSQSNITIENRDKMYYSIDDYNSLKILNDNFTLFSLNINSLRKYNLEFLNFIKRF